MPSIDAEAVWQAARLRWADIVRNSPDLQPAVTLQQSLMRLTLGVSDQLSGQAALAFPLSSDAVAAKWVRGVPAWRNEGIPIPPFLPGTLPALCAALVKGGAGDSAQHIGDAIADGRIDAGSLLLVSLARNESAMRTSALHMGFAPDLLWLIGELASSPLAHQLQVELLSRPESRDALMKWDRGYCPCCGSWPVAIEVVGDSRLLRCSFCAAAWELTSRRCLYCANSGPDFVSAAADPARATRRIDMCGRCGGYTKVIESAASTPFPLLAVEDLASLDLDEAAMSRDYTRPDLYNLDGVEPLSTGCA